jgi:hypothetical protein
MVASFLQDPYPAGLPTCGLRPSCFVCSKYPATRGVLAALAPLALSAGSTDLLRIQRLAVNVLLLRSGAIVVPTTCDLERTGA